MRQDDYTPYYFRNPHRKKEPPRMPSRGELEHQARIERAQAEIAEQLKKQNRLLERIAASLEKIANPEVTYDFTLHPGGES